MLIALGWMEDGRRCRRSGGSMDGAAAGQSLFALLSFPFPLLSHSLPPHHAIAVVPPFRDPCGQTSTVVYILS